MTIALRTARTGRWALLIVLTMVLFSQFGSQFDRFVLSSALLISMLALVTDLQWGYTGILNLGPSAYFGLGAYTYALMVTRVAHSTNLTYAALAISVAACIALALLVAYPAFKVRTIPLYYALITLAVALVLERYVSVSYQLTGGSNGIIGIPGLDLSIGPVPLKMETVDDYYPVVGVVVVACYLAFVFLTESRIGTVLRAIREDEEKTRTLGYNTMRYKLGVAGLGGAVGGLAGALYAPLTGIAHPSFFALVISIQAFIFVAIGGQGTLIGPIAATVLITLLENYLRGVSTEGYLLMVAVAFVLAVIFLPRGLVGVAESVWRSTTAVAARRSSSHRW